MEYTYNKENYFILYFDVLVYPPILSLIKILLENGQSATLLGNCSKPENINYLIEKGLEYKEFSDYSVDDSKMLKFRKMVNFKKKVDNYLNKIERKSNVWLIGNEPVYLFHKWVKLFNTNIYFFEVPKFSVLGNFRLFCNLKQYKRAVKNAGKIINCEFNRGLITKSFFGLNNEQTIIIPNKTYLKVEPLDNKEVLSQLDRISGKKILLYQGGFNYPERRLDEFCEAVNFLPDEFVVVIMGPNTTYKDELIKKYESERVIFFPFIKAPFHLNITLNAYIGFLTYFPNEGQIDQILNVLYCAPNKIFEYSNFGVPILSNSLPAMNYFVTEYNCGKTVDIFTPQVLANAILEIDNNYEFYKEGAYKVYNSVDTEKIIIENFS